MGELLTELEAAEFLRLNRQTLSQWRARNVGPAYIVIGARSIRYPKLALEKYLAERVVPSIDSGR